jgi:hypothetical protein
MNWYSIAAIAIGTGLAGYFWGNYVGYAEGRDTQRVKDILELWRNMPDRDARGRFKQKAQ